MKWSHFDNWLAKFFAFVIIIGGLGWMTFSVRWHYHTRASDWEYLPFVVSGLAIMFSLAILSKAATAGAAAVILPFVDRLRLGKETTSSTIIPAQPAQPATIVTTTTAPLPVPPRVPDLEDGTPEITPP